MSSGDWRDFHRNSLNMFDVACISAINRIFLLKVLVFDLLFMDSIQDGWLRYSAPRRYFGKTFSEGPFIINGG